MTGTPRRASEWTIHSERIVDDTRRAVLSIADVELHIAKPGESVRIIHSLDVVEPRWKVAGPGGVFPGFVSPPSAVGEGQTNRLAGVAVVGVLTLGLILSVLLLIKALPARQEAPEVGRLH